MSSQAVNKPTDVKQKERDVNTKLQLYGICHAFANRKLPSNKQIDVALNSVLESRALKNPSTEISSEGQLLIGDLRNAIEQAKILLLVKNEGNVLQDFIWHAEQFSGGTATTPEAPVDSLTAQEHGGEALDGLRTLGTLLISNGQFRKLLNDAIVLLRDMAGDAATDAAKRVKPSEEQLSQIDRPADDNTWHDVPDLSKDSVKNQLRNQTGFRSQQQRADEDIPDEAKGRTKEYYGKTKDYLSSKITQERRDQTIWRLKKMVIEVQGHKDYQQAIETLLRLVEIYAGHGENLHQQGRSNFKGAHEDDHLKAAEADLKVLIERLANSTSVDDLSDAISNIYRDADRDPELKDWFKKLDAYIRRCLQEQGFIVQDAAKDEWNGIYDRGQFLLRDRYRDHVNRIIDESKFLMDQFAEDPQSKKFGEVMQKLFNDLGNDENGKPVFKKRLVEDLTNVIIPATLENIRYIPVPRIEFSDPTMDAIVENLIVESDNLMPNILEIESDNHFKWSRKQMSSKHSVMVSASGIQCDLRDVSYYIKKRGFPSITDQGVADILLGGQGLSFKMKLSTTTEKKDRQCFFKIDKVDVNVKHLNIKLKHSNHKLLFGLFKPLLFGIVRPAIQKALEKQIRDSMHQFDGVIYQIHQEAEEAKQAGDDFENSPNIYSRYYRAAQKRLLQGEEKASKVAPDKKVNVAITQQDSMFKNISLPSGISSKATEYKELAAKGDRWESPVFSIGTAQETPNIPKVSPITRKHHDLRQGGLRDANGNASPGRGDFSKVNQAFDNNAQQEEYS